MPAVTTRLVKFFFIFIGNPPELLVGTLFLSLGQDLVSIWVQDLDRFLDLHQWIIDQDFRAFCTLVT